MTKRSQLILAVVILGLFFLGLGYWTSKNPTPEIGLGLRLATAIHETGEAEVIRGGLSQRTKLDKKSEMGNLDSLETFEIGEATLIFENGFRVRVFGNSLITLERVNDAENYHVLMIIKRGDVRIDQNGQEGSLVVSKNGLRIAAQAFNDSELKRAPTKTDPTANDNPTTANNNSLSEEEIAATMNGNKINFFRCFTRLLQKQPMARGQAQLTFLIKNSGKPEELEVAVNMTPPVLDEDFKKCLHDVLARIEFKSFNGPAISTVFPLQFE